MSLNLSQPSEPREIRDWMLSLEKKMSFENIVYKDTYIVWSGNKLPKYLWDYWKNDLKPLGLTWQKFMKILHHRTDIGVLWYQGKLPWADFIKKISELMDSPIGKEVYKTLNTSVYGLPLQDIGSLQIPAFSDWEPFERFCRDLWARVWDNQELQLYGRSGQVQAGVDVYGSIRNQTESIGGIQCKKRDAFADDSLTVDELRQIVKEAKKFKPALNEFVVAYTGKRDTNLQNEALRLTKLNKKNNLFSVRVCSWNDIKEMLSDYPELIDKYNLVITGVGVKAVEGIKSSCDSILKSQTEQSKDTKDIAQGINNIKDEINKSRELAKSSASSDLTGEYDREIDEIRDLINFGRSKEAYDRIVKLEERLKINVTDTIKFRILTNKAASLAALGDEKKAGMLFIEAFQYNFKDEKALCNKALGHLFVGQRDESVKLINKVLQKNPLNQQANELLIYTAAPTENLQSIIERIPEVLRQNGSIAYAVADVAHERGIESEVIYWLEIALKKSDSNKSTLNIKANFASIILQAFEKRYDVLSKIQITLSDKEKLERALSFLDDAIGSLEQSETLKYRANWIMNRAVAHNLLGHSDKALADTEFAIKLQPDNLVFLKQKAFLLHLQGKSEDAIFIFRQIINNPKLPEVTLLLAGIFYERKEDDLAIKILEESVKDINKSGEILLEEKRLLIYAYMRKEQFDLARKIVNELRGVNPGSVKDLVIAAVVEKRSNNLNVYNQLLNDARAYVADNTPLRDLFELAEELYVSKRYADAWSLYERLVDPRSGSSLVNRLIYSYYEAELYEKALEVARSVPEKYKDRFIYDVEVSILDSMGDLENAIFISEKYLYKHPEDLAFKVKCAGYLLRKNQLEKLDSFLLETHDLSKLSEDLKFEVTMQIAWLYSQRKMSLMALETVYILRKNSPRNSNAHMAYMSIFFDREKDIDDQLSSSVVNIDTAVAVEESGNVKRWFVIEENPGSDKDALSLNDPLAKKLIGKKINEEIIRDEGKPSETRLKIVEITSKYVHALHDTMAILPHLFDEKENPPLKRLMVKTNPEAKEETKNQLMQIMELTSARDEHILRVQKQYEEGKLPIGVFANLIGRDPITIWGGLVNNPRIKIRCCEGTIEERKEAIQYVRGSDTVAVDLIALLTLGSVDNLKLLQVFFKEIFVAQSTIDILLRAINEKNGIGSKGFMTIYKEDGEYYRKEVSAEDIQKQIVFLKKIKDWIEKNCTVQPVGEILRLSKERRKRLYDTIGDSFIDTMMIAKEQKCPIYSDDHGTRAIARNDFGVRGFWTQVLAIVAAEKKFIFSEDLEKINISLCELNYSYTTINGSTLFYAAKSSKWINEGVFVKVLANITGLNTELKSTMGVVIDFFYQLWKEPTLSDSQRESFVFATFDLVTQQKDRMKVMKFAEIYIPLRFQLIPIASNHLLRLITAWRSIRN